MPQARKEPRALAAIVQRVFAKQLRETVTRGRGDCTDSVVRAPTPAVALYSLVPIAGRIVRLIVSSHQRRTDNGIRTKGVKQIVHHLDLLRRSFIPDHGFGLRCTSLSLWRIRECRVVRSGA